MRRSRKSPCAAAGGVRLPYGVMADDMLEHIARYRFPRGAVLAERRGRGITLTRVGSGAPIARLRPVGRDDRVEVLHWSHWKQRWAAAGPFGRTILPIDDALRLVAEEDLFWASP